MIALFLLLFAPPEETLSAAEIMRRVAENQERSESARAQYVYRQNAMVRLLRTNGKLSREEKHEYVVTPTPKGIEKKMVKFEGQYEEKGKLHPYDQPGFEHKDTDLDAELATDLIEDLTNDDESKDGVDADLFPLTKKAQADKVFTLRGTSKHRGRQVYRIGFEPIDKSDFGWTGEALVDAEEFQPVFLQTKLSRGLPMAVKVLLGTNLKQLGFSLSYNRVAPGVWFPVSYGTEFRIDAFWFYKRNITFSMANSDFRKTDVSSTIDFTTK